ncbi:molecular chaperone DnaJ [Anditalea andensis]|uniref:molecular chaperone DnaJ n=1 Tax=Anditalea andensis TaxID=1048983 RepID=UPI001F0A4E8E|nr:molecular chaperone DnaJ [Anditalea andensis]
MNKIIIIIACSLLLPAMTHAQLKPHLGETSRKMNTAIDAMESGQYEKANHIFREIIESKVPLPSEMPYYFAETLFRIGQYDNSANFLNKYLEINGFKGDNYDAAKMLEEKLIQPLSAIKACSYCDRKGYRYLTCSTCNGAKSLEQACNVCKGKAIVGCSRCAASGMVTKKNVFNIMEYYECDRCEGKGRLTCHACEGSKIVHSKCRTCNGSGTIGSDELCDHLEHKH